MKTVTAVLATASFTSSLSIWCDPTGQSGDGREYLTKSLTLGKGDLGPGRSGGGH
jgi:hypothetical protein